MEVASFHPLSYNYLFPSAHHYPQNHVQWDQTPQSHIYSAEIQGVRKEDIKVEVEESRYLFIRTTAEGAHRSFSRKFRLPGQVDIDRISAVYVDGILTVKVPRTYVSRGFFIDPAESPPQSDDLLARAA